ncbi:SH2 domain-containing 5-like protein [Labeo rohita]|uniref:SH2 domain-containing 5-like protein n=1 Tax=Labeo rohita TaxID=84645 RepID=A0A498MTD4_LABRO|nr:SH2 domain-containing 5-like protein [Labeo rohita]
MGETADREHGIVTRSAEYIGSFPVDDSCLDDQIQQLHSQLKSFKNCKSKRTVSLRFSVKGVKVYDEDEMTLLMAHAMCRVSLSTARPSDAQFAFVSHNPGNSDAQLYCHLFKARHARAVFSQPSTEQVSSPEEGPTSSPTLVRKRAIRTKELRSGAYRSFTFTPLKQRHLQDKLSARQEKEQASAKACNSRAPSLAETEEALAQAVWCWAGVSSDCSSSLLADDVLGAFLLCPHPKKPNRVSLIVRFPSGLITHAVKNSKGKFRLEKCHIDFESLPALIEHYTEFSEELECSLSWARVNHCYDWEEIVKKSSRSLQDNKKGIFKSQSWV